MSFQNQMNTKYNECNHTKSKSDLLHVRRSVSVESALCGKRCPNGSIQFDKDIEIFFYYSLCLYKNKNNLVKDCQNVF